MLDSTQPVLVLTMSPLTDADTKLLDTNFSDVSNAVPDDLMAAFTKAGKTLTANARLSILAGGSQWLLADGANYYEMKASSGDLSVYAVSAAAFSVLQAKAKTAVGVTSMNLITMACHAIQNTEMNLPDGIPKPDWFDPLVAHLDDAKVLADEWINTLGPDLTSRLPKKLVDYSTEYNAITAQIVKIADANPMAKGADDPNVKNVFALIDALTTEVSSIENDILAEDAKLQAWGTKMQTAYDNLSTGVASIQSTVADLNADIGAMKAAIAGLNAKIDSENKAIAASAAAIGIGIFAMIVGVALAPVTGGASLVVTAIGAAAVIGGAVTWGIMQHRIDEQYKEIAKDQKEMDFDQRQIVALTGLETSTQQATSSIAIATSALSDVRALWKLLAGELDGVVTQLKQADKELALIVNEAFVNGAQEEWKLAAELANQILNKPVKIESKTLPMSAVA